MTVLTHLASHQDRGKGMLISNQALLILSCLLIAIGSIMVLASLKAED